MALGTVSEHSLMSMKVLLSLHLHRLLSTLNMYLNIAVNLLLQQLE